jgi:hypothetical protein
VVPLSTAHTPAVVDPGAEVLKPPENAATPVGRVCALMYTMSAGATKLVLGAA